MSDRLHDTLSTLRTDVDSMPLADSSAVRARGAQRTRRQAVGTSLAVVALVAGAVGISGALTGTNKASELPSDRTTTTTAPVETREAIGTDLLIGAKQLPSFPNQPFTTGETLDQATTADTEERGLAVCGAPPSGGVTPESAILRTFITDLDIRMWQWMAQYATAAEAQAAVEELSSTCARNGASPVDIDSAPMPGMDTALKSAKFSADPGSEFNGSVAGIVRQGDVVMVLGLNGMLRESDVDMDAFDASVASAAERLSTR